MRTAYAVVCVALASLGACGDNLQGNRSPSASDSNVTTPEDTPVSITVNAMDPDRDDGLIFSFTPPEHGTITQDGGTVTYRPADDYTGPDSIHVDITDGTYDVTAEIAITVTPVNDAPVAIDDALAADEDTAATVTGAALVANDVDVENDALTVTMVANPSSGTVGLVGDTITYTPPANFNGSATFEYTVSDGAASDVGLVTVTVGGVNDPPVAVTDSVTTAEDTTATITAATLVANDTDTEGQSLSVTGVGGAVNGTVNLAGGTVTFSPDANYSGAASFTYTVSDGAATATGTVDVTVTAVNDTPVANAGSASVDEDGSVQITVSATDVEGDNLTFATATGPANGTLSAYTQLTASTAQVTYTPAGNYNGPDSFTFTASDAQSTSPAATVSVTVNAVNDAPVATPGSTMTMEDNAVTIVLTGTDTENQALTFAVATPPSRGSLGSITQMPPNSAMVTYTPNLDNDQDDSFTFTANDGGQDSAPATFTIDVIPVNDGPTAVADSDTTLMNTDLVRAGSTYTANDTDVDGPGLTIMSVGNPSNGSVSLNMQTITFSPAMNFSGAAGFDYTVTDGSLTSTAHVTVTVINTNTPPTAVDDNDTTPEDVPLVRAAATYTANDTDPEPQTLTITAVQDAQNGSVSLVAGTITFTPNPDFVGNGSFDYVVSDGIATDIGTVTVAVTSVNDLPLATNDGATVDEDGSVNTNVLANDTGLGDGNLAVTIATPATNGSAVPQGDNTVTYTPNANFNGSDSYSYTVTDGDGDASTATVSITVNPVNDAPVAQGQTITMNENTSRVVTLTATDIDVPAQNLTFAIATGPSNGTLGAITPVTATTADVTYTPSPNYVGPDSFTFTASDGTATSAPATIAITVNNVVVCNDGLIEAPEMCDDQGNAPGDGCSATCQVEPGWSCIGAPSACDPVCNDGLVLGGEACDDGNAVDTDGCTTTCELGAVCAVATFAGGDRFATNPADGHCYVSFDSEQTTWANAQAACTAITGHLVSITSAGEQTVVASVQNTAENPWIGATDALVEGSFGWITAEPFGYDNFEPGQPDGGDAEDCVNLFSTAASPSSTAGTWNDTSCDFIGFTAGRICEIESGPCGNGVLEAAFGETCDDGNRASYDGCSLACQVETGAVCTGTAPTTCSKLVINEFDYDMSGTDATEFVEILNTGTAAANLTNHIFVHVNGSNSAEILRVALSGALAPQQYLVICPMTATPGTCPVGITVAPGAVIVNFAVATNILQNDNEGIGIFNLGNNTMVDAVSYEGAVTNGTISGAGTFSFVEGPTAVGSDTAANAWQRFHNGRDTQRNSVDFVLRLPSPGAATPP